MELGIGWDRMAWDRWLGIGGLVGDEMATLGHQFHGKSEGEMVRGG